jgi:hypothetical protein
MPPRRDHDTKRKRPSGRHGPGAVANEKLRLVVVRPELTDEELQAVCDALNAERHARFGAARDRVTGREDAG